MRAIPNLLVEKMIRKLTLAILLFVAHSISTGPLVQNVPDLGVVDWSNFLLKTKGIGRLNPSLPVEVRREGALDAATKDASVKALQLLSQLNHSSPATVGEFLASNDSLHVLITDAISENLKVVSEVYLSDGSIELDCELPLLGPLMALLLPKAWAENSYFMANVPQKEFTGVVIDARGLKLNPSVLPRVLDQAGTEVYGTGFAERESAVRTGLCAWVKDSLDVQHERVGDAPLMLKAAGVSGKDSTDLVVSDRDGGILHALPESRAVLRSCKLIILLN
jgi:hypothetical protein